MEYKTTAEVAEKWGITRRRVSKLCSEGRVEGAVLTSTSELFAVRPCARHICASTIPGSSLTMM